MKHNPFATELAKQRKSLFLWSPVAVGAGIVTYFQLSDVISWVTLAFAVVFIVMAFAKSVHGYANTGQNRWLAAVLFTLALALFIMGYGSAKLRTESLNTPLLTENLPPVTVQGTIEKLVTLDGGKAKRVVLSNIEIIDNAKAPTDWAHIRLKTYHFKGDDWRTGDRVEVRAKLLPPSGPVMPGGFDFRFKAYYERLSAVGYTMGDAQKVAESNTNSGQIQHFRAVIGSNLYGAMDAPIAGIAQALLTGERAGMSEDDVEALRVAGLAHLLAISGLHIGLVAGCVFFFIRLLLAAVPNLALYHPIKKYAAVCAIIVAFVYMILAGATVPTVRAFIMTSLVLLAVILDRSALNMRLVALAALFVMLTTPEAVMGPSFVLSFAAVAALIAFYQGAGREWLNNARSFQPLWRPVYYLLGIIATTIVATLATAPFSVMFFNRFAVYSIIANIGAMPLMAFIVMPFGLLGTILIPTGLDNHIWPVMAWGIAKILHIAHHVAAYDGADLYLPSFGALETILITAGFLWVILWRGYYRWAGVFFVSLALILPFVTARPMIFISEKMEAILIVDKSRDNIYEWGKMNGYLRRNWLASLGINPSVDILSYRKGDNVPYTLGLCDDYYCLFKMEGHKIAVTNHPLSLQYVCSNADIVIATFPVKKGMCKGPYIIDRFDIWRSGATTIRFTQGQYKVTNVEEIN